MTSKRIGAGALIVAAVAAWLVVANSLTVSAQPPAEPKEVTLTGRVVDLQCFMTGHMPSDDHAKCTADCIRAGVPAALETSEGLVMLGQGMEGPAKALVPFAYQNIQAKGKLYEKNGVKYLDITSVEKAPETPGQ